MRSGGPEEQNPSAARKKSRLCPRPRRCVSTPLPTAPRTCRRARIRSFGDQHRRSNRPKQSSSRREIWAARYGSDGADTNGPVALKPRCESVVPAAHGTGLWLTDCELEFCISILNGYTFLVVVTQQPACSRANSGHPTLRSRRPYHSIGSKRKGSAGAKLAETSPAWIRTISTPRSSILTPAPSVKSSFLKSTQKTLGEMADST